MVGLTVIGCALGLILGVLQPWIEEEKLDWTMAFNSKFQLFTLSDSGVRVITLMLPIAALIVGVVGLIFGSARVSVFAAGFLAAPASLRVAIGVGMVVFDRPAAFGYLDEDRGVIIFAASSLVLVVTVGRMLWLDVQRRRSAPSLRAAPATVAAVCAGIAAIVRWSAVRSYLDDTHRSLSSVLIILLLLPFVLAMVGALSRHGDGRSIAAGIFASQLFVPLAAWRFDEPLRWTSHSAGANSAIAFVASACGLIALVAGLRRAQRSLVPLRRFLSQPDEWDDDAEVDNTTSSSGGR